MQQTAHYGGTFPAKLGREFGSSDWTEDLATGTSFAHFVPVFLGSLGVFVLNVALFSFLLFYHAYVALELLVLGLAACVYLIWNRRSNPFFLPMGICCMIAACLGAVIGTTCYDRYGCFIFLYSNSRIYENIVPFEKASTVADAGRIIFAAEAHVEQSQSVGLAAEDGETYCVAPIRSVEGSSQVEYWAVGLNCCSTVGGFDCDAASDPNARAGAVVFTNSGILKRTTHDQFDLARKKAEATFGLQTGDAPMYVRWVTIKDADFLTSSFTLNALVYIGLATLCYAGLSAGFVWVVCKSFMYA